MKPLHPIKGFVYVIKINRQVMHFFEKIKKMAVRIYSYDRHLEEERTYKKSELSALDRYNVAWEWENNKSEGEHL